MVHVPYRDFNQALVDIGEGPASTQVAGGRGLRFCRTPQAGKLGFAGPSSIVNSAAFAPEVPTVAEAGYPELTFDAVTGFFGWRDMPAELRERLAADVREGRFDRAIQERLLKMGSVARGSTPAEFVGSFYRGAAHQDRGDHSDDWHQAGAKVTSLQDAIGAAAMNASARTTDRIVKLAFAFREAKVVLERGSSWTYSLCLPRDHSISKR